MATKKVTTQDEAVELETTESPEVAVAPVAVEAVPDVDVDEDELTEAEVKQTALIKAFCDEFASSQSKREQITALVKRAATGKEFAKQFGKSPRHKTYLAARFDALLESIKVVG